MDKNTAKQILSAYRSNGADANDENFKEAIQLCQNDSEMAQWFESEIAFDKEFSRSIRSISAPQEGKQALLATVSFDQPENVSRISYFLRKSVPYTVAAAAAIAVLVWQSPQPNTRSHDSSQPISLAMLSSTALPLQHKTSNIEEINHWLDQQGAPVPAFIPEAISSAAKTAGCRAFNDGNGGKISLYCFQLNGKLLHVFVYDKNNDTFPNLPEREWRRQDGWNVYSWSQDNYKLAIASPIDPALLDPIVASI